MRERATPMRALWMTTVLVSTVCALPRVVGADLASCPPVRDNTLYESIDGTLSNGAGPHLFAGVTSEGLIREALMSFNLAAIPSGSTVTSATLVVTVSRANGAPIGTLHRVLSPWGEGTSVASEPGGEGAQAAAGDATWTHAFWPDVPWNTVGGDVFPDPSSLAALPPAGVVTWPSTSAMVADVQGWLEQPDANFGWMVVGFGGAARFSSRESSLSGSRPALVVEYTPPCAADFNGSGAVSVQDIFDFLTAYFGGDLAADFNASGGVSVQDILEFLAAYFSPCA